MTYVPRPLMPLDDALAAVLAAVTPITQVQVLDTVSADGRVLAADVFSPLHVPSCDNSAMDGYAMRHAEVPFAGVVLPVSQRIAAGSSPQPLALGTAARIFTGAPLPLGADAVVMQEQCEAMPPSATGQAQVRVGIAVQLGQSVRYAGEDLTQGALVLAAGTQLSPAHIGVAASMGLAHLSVIRSPRVALLSTGDELVMPGAVAPEHMPAGAIYNSNRYFLTAMLRRMGCHVTDLGSVADHLQATKDALHQASQQHDVVLTSGGVSVGEEDHVKAAVQALGHLDLWSIAMKPGKPFALGRLGDAAFMGLPGNPVASFVTFLMLVRPYLLRLQGVHNVAPLVVDAVADFDWPHPDKRREFLRVRRAADGRVALFPNQSSGVLTSVAWADGVIDNPPQHAIKAGDTVRFIPWAGWL